MLALTPITSRPAPGIYKAGSDVLASPRVSVLGQADYGEKLNLFALGRADRGFDATDGVAKARPDEYYPRLDPLDGPMRFPVGKFGTAYGQWARRYLEWDNPMVTALLAYEWVSTAGDGQTAPTASRPLRASSPARVGRLTGPAGRPSSGGRFIAAASASTERSRGSTTPSRSRTMP